GNPVQVATMATLNFNLQGWDLSPQPPELLAAGRAFTANDAASAEQLLSMNPNDEALHVKLLAYYTQSRNIAERRKMLLWLVENTPESRVFSMREAMLLARGNSVADPEGHEKIKSL